MKANPIKSILLLALLTVTVVGAIFVYDRFHQPIENIPIENIPTPAVGFPFGIMEISPTYPVSLENHYYILSNENIVKVRIEFMNHSDMNISGTLTVNINPKLDDGSYDNILTISNDFSGGQISGKLTITIPASSRENYVIDTDNVLFQRIAENKIGISVSLEVGWRIYIWGLEV